MDYRQERKLMTGGLVLAGTAGLLWILFTLSWLADAKEGEPTSFGTKAVALVSLAIALGGVLLALLGWLNMGKGRRHYLTRIAIVCCLCLAAYFIGVKALIEDWMHTDLPF